MGEEGEEGDDDDPRKAAVDRPCRTAAPQGRQVAMAQVPQLVCVCVCCDRDGMGMGGGERG